MTFTIEVYKTTDDGSELVLHRTTVTAINPLGARKEASRILEMWKKRKASVRVLNHRGETIF
jgi:hypothetical protein